MATDSDETIPIFTINDFPTELIVRFAPDLRARTVSTLRLVSRRFRDVFSADIYYRSYLYYSDMPEMYRRDLEEIGDEEGRWRRCLEAEKCRLDNWKNGRTTRVDTVEIPINLIPCQNPEEERRKFEWQGKTGEVYDHWMLSECRNRKIVLLNVTKAPIMTVVDVSSYTSLSENFAFLLPDQVLIDSGTVSKRVFNILNDGENLSLRHLFTFEANEEDGLSFSGYLKIIRSYRSLYVSYQDKPTDAVLKVWDLKRGVWMKNIVTTELLSPRFALDFGQLRSLEVLGAEFPHVLVAIRYGEEFFPRLLVAVINVEKSRLVLWFQLGAFQKMELKCCDFKENTLLLEFFDRKHRVTVLRVYDLRMRPSLKDKTGLLFQFESHSSFGVHFMPRMLIISDFQKHHFVSIDGSEVFQRQVEAVFNISSAIGPFLVTNQCSGLLSSSDMFGKVGFAWIELLPEGLFVDRFDICLVQVRDMYFYNLTKSILQNRRGNNLHICYF